MNTYYMTSLLMFRSFSIMPACMHLYEKNESTATDRSVMERRLLYASSHSMPILGLSLLHSHYEKPVQHTPTPTHTHTHTQSHAEADGLTPESITQASVPKDR
mmetsp:Transcript_37184/g.73161  ORF Transcript_37184/g.73161 Transcript_37184/m.73161 type:complete len:103 (+) Transcript_37184:361-669(+)